LTSFAAKELVKKHLISHGQRRELWMANSETGTTKNIDPDFVSIPIEQEEAYGQI